MSDEAKEIERLGVALHQWRRFDELESQQIYALARRLLEERDEANIAAESAQQLHALEHAENLRSHGLGTPEEIRERIASLERELASYEGMDRAVTHYQEEVRRLERERDEARSAAETCAMLVKEYGGPIYTPPWKMQ